jgi:hypothetical protein
MMGAATGEGLMFARPHRSFWFSTLSIALLASVLALAPSASAAVCTDTAAGQLARWPGDNSTAEVAHGRNGTLVGDTTYAAGKVGQAFSFDGVGDTVTVSDNRDWTLDGDFTIDTWVNFNGVGGDIAFIGHDEAQGFFPKWLLWRKGTGELSFHINTGATSVDAVSYAWSVGTGQWYHVAVTRAGNTFTLYVDGASVATATDATAIPDAAAPVTLGSAESDFHLNGLLDEPEIYQRALSSTEVKAIYDAGTNARCAITRSTLTFAPQGWAYPNESLTLNGSLALSGGASVSGLPIDITKSVDGGSPVALPSTATASDGSFSVTDTPAAGSVVYRAIFAGATNVSAENAYAKVAVKRKTSALSVALSKSTVKLGDAVTVTAHLKGGSTNRTVTIWAVPSGGSKQKLEQGKVNRKGNLSARHKPTRKTKYYATYTGDAHWTADTSSSKTVHVVPRWSRKIIGGYATVNGVRLYHYSSKCSPTNSTGCPAATFTLSPNHGGERVYFQGRYCHNGKCIDDSGSFRLNRKSKISVFIYYGDKSIIGWTLNFRMRFPGDTDHTASTSAWVKTKVTA